MNTPTNNTEPLQIDIDQIIKSKNPGLYKMLPGFIIRYIKKILHQDDNNYYLRKYRDKKGKDFSEAILNDWNIKTKAEGEENIPDEGRFVFAANHPLGGIESLAFMKVVQEHYPNIKFPVNDILLNLEPFDEIFLPINKHGSQSKLAAQKIDEAYASGAQICFFPAGLVSRKIKGKVIDLEWKKSFISKAIQHKRDIIPVHISGRNSNFFYRLGNFRKFIGIKANIEMFYLANELYKHKNTTLTIRFGKPISHTMLTKEKNHKEWAQYVKNKCYDLAD
ncbi:MAG: glycerol acyltransferase [Marinilabiliales bacterium]|nr:MAG: glycerol acyltransferase [Marinilabiliales bacterium]